MASGKIPAEVLEEIRRRVDIAAVVGEHVRLKRAGASLKGLCPFHEEKSPSFNVSPEKHIFHCFGCGVGGDVFAFLTRITGSPFPQVVQDLATLAGVDLSPYRRAGEKPASDRAGLYGALKQASEFFRSRLAGSQRAEGYLATRGLDAVTREAFGIGYAPDSWSELHDHLVGRGVPLEILFEAGLVRKRREGNGHYDLFRDRIVFPIRDEHGRVVGFGGRRLGEGEGPKYLNSPEGPVYSKGQILYNLDRAQQALHGAELPPVLCEGYMDVIALARAGIPQAVAPLGTALTQAQASRMQRLSKRWVLAFDADPAGRRAAAKAIQLLDPLGVEARILSLKGKDPDEVLQHEGPEALRKAVREARPVDEFLFQSIAADHDLASGPGRSDAFRELRGLFEALVSPLLKEALIRRVSDGLSVGEDLVRQAFRASQAGERAVEELSDRAGSLPRQHATERMVLREVLQDISHLRTGAARDLTPASARDPYVKQCLVALGELPESEGPVFDALLAATEDEALARFVRSLAFGEEPTGGEEAPNRVARWMHDLGALEARDRARRIREEMLSENDNERRTTLLREYQAVQRELDRLRTSP